MSKVYWSRELTVSLIELYLQHPSLWDVRSDIYRDRDARIVSIVQITRELNKTDANMKQEEVNRKLTLL